MLWHAKLDTVLRSWLGTPYVEGSQTKQGGVDCRHYVCGCADEMLGVPFRKLPTMAADVSLHSARATIEVMRTIADMYGAYRLRDGGGEPGDVLVTGPTNGGPGHTLILGVAPGTVWECAGGGVRESSLGSYLFQGQKLICSYRMPNKDELWLPR